MKENDDKYINNGSGGSTDHWKGVLKENPFTVPDGYFTDLEATTKFRCRQDILLTKDNYPVPVGYFDGLEQQITGRIAEENLRALVPMSGFSAPEAYFTTLEEQILARTARSVEETVSDEKRTDIRKIFTPSWIGYAAAACLLLVSSLWITDRLQTDNPTRDLSSIPDQELISYLQIYSGTQDVMFFSEYAADFAELDFHSDLSNEEIEWYLENML